MKHVKESTTSDEKTNQDIENTAKNIKSSEETMEIIKEMEKKLLEVIITAFYGLPTSKFKYLKNMN